MKRDNRILYTKQTNVRPIAIERVPDNWGISRAKNVFNAVDERSTTGDEELLSVSHITGVTPRSEKNINMFLAESYKGYKLCKPRDLVVNSLWVWMKALGFSEYAGIVSTAYGVYRLTDESIFNYKYLDYLLRSDYYGGEYLVRSKGIWTSRLLLSDDAFFTIPILVPPRKEQDAIVKFLDEKIADIDKYISAKQKLIELLNEQKAAIINQAVTKGVDSNVKMKDSGIEWLGEIPVNWELKKMKFVNKVIMGQSPNSEDYNSVGDGPPFLQGNAEFTKLYPKPILCCSSATKFSEKDDILFSVRAPVGAVNISDQKYGIGRGLSAIRCKKSFNKFIFYQLIARKQEFLFVSSGSTFDAISTKDLNNFFTILPPFSEQKAICHYIETKLENVETAIERNILAINKINIYKNSLMAEAVTGKLKIT